MSHPAASAGYLGWGEYCGTAMLQYGPDVDARPLFVHSNIDKLRVLQIGKLGWDDSLRREDVVRLVLDGPSPSRERGDSLR